MPDFIVSIDTQLMYFFNVTLHNPVFNWLMPLLSDDHFWRIPFLLAFLLLMIFGGSKGRWAGLGAIVLVIMTDQIASHVIKPLIARIRPCNVLGELWLWKHEIWLLIPEPVIEIYKSSYSFPSSHAANSGGQMIWWSVLYPRTRWFWYILGFGIGFSRLYNGVHYPFDVVGGWCVGAVCFAGIWIVVQRWGPGKLRGSPDLETPGKDNHTVIK